MSTSTSFRARDGTILEARQDVTVVHIEGHSVPDEAWRFTDAAGHGHYYRGGYPTLKEVWYLGWCGRCRDTHDEGEILDHYECAECGEDISPAVTWTGPSAVQLPGLRSYTRCGWITVTGQEAQRMYGAGEVTQVRSGRRGAVQVYIDQDLTPEQFAVFLEEARDRSA